MLLALDGALLTLGKAVQYSLASSSLFISGSLEQASSNLSPTDSTESSDVQIEITRVPCKDAKNIQPHATAA